MEQSILLACQGKSKSQGGLNVSDIRKVLSDRGMSSTGSRADLIKRLCSSSAPASAKAKTAPSPASAKTAPAPASAATPAPAPASVRVYRPSRDEFELPANRILADAQFREKRFEVQLDEKFMQHMKTIVEASSFETGGLIDLDLDGKFDQSAYHIGNEGSVSMMGMHDFEITYHVHPPRKVSYDVPSDVDIASLLVRSDKPSSAHQVDLVFTADAIYASYVSYNPNGHGSHEMLLEKCEKLWETNPYGSALRNEAAMKWYFAEARKLGCFIVRHGFIDRDESLRYNEVEWPDEVLLYIKPIEDVSFARTPKTIMEKLQMFALHGELERLKWYISNGDLSAHDISILYEWAFKYPDLQVYLKSVMSEMKK